MSDSPSYGEEHEAVDVPVEEVEQKEVGEVKTDDLEEDQPSEIDQDDVEQLEAMQRKIREMEEEAAQIKAAMATQTENSNTQANSPEIDSRSVYVGCVDYSVTSEELQTFFQSCGTVNRVTILTDKFSGHPKGFAYVEFASTEDVANAMLLNESELRGRQLKISPKRTNVPGFGMRRRSRRRSRRRNRRSHFQPY